MAEVTSPADEFTKRVNRREFLNFAWLASLGFITLNIAGATYLFSMPRFKEGEFGGVVTVGTVAEMPEAEASPLNFPKVKFWLSHTSQGVMALYKVCTHLGCLYNWREQEHKFVCPCHGSQFELNGNYILGPAPRSLDRFAIQIVDQGSGEVIAQSENGEPLPLPENANAIVRVDTGKRIKGAPHA